MATKRSPKRVNAPLTFTSLHAAGYEPLPAEGKGVYLDGWPTLDVAAHVAAWDASHKGNIGLRCGLLRGLDVDILDAPLSEAIEEAVRREFVLNGTPTRIGLAPKRLLPLRASQPGVKREVRFFRDGEPAGKVELLGAGQQFIGFGIHPDTGKPYQWSGELPPFEHLPEMGEAELDRMLATIQSVAEAHGLTVEAPEKPQGKREAKPRPTVEPVEKRVREASLCLDALPNETDGAIGWEQWKQVGGVLHHHLHDAPEEAWALFDEFSQRHPRYNAKNTRKAWKDSRTFDSLAFGTLIHFAREALGNPTWNPADEAGLLAAPAAPPRPPELDQGQADAPKFPPPPEGPLAEMQRLILANSRRPHADAALLGALIAAAACIGNRYRLPDNTRLNLYALMVGTTGSGKDAPMQMSAQIVHAVNMALGGTVIGVQTGRVASGEGLEDALVANGGEVFWQHDESAHASAAGKTRIDPNRVGLDGVILRLWSASMASYQTRAKANRQGKKQGGELIAAPYLNMLEATTPSAIEQYMTPAMIGQGRFGRMLFTMLDGDVPLRRLREWHDVPDALVHRMVALRRGPGDKVATIIVPPDVDALLDTTMQELDEAARGSRTETGAMMRQRSFEKVQRVAGLLAVLQSGGKPTLTAAHVRWARQLVEASDDVALGEVTSRLSNDELEAQRLKVMETMQRILEGKLKVRNPRQEGYLQAGYIVRSTLLKATKLDAKAFDMAINTLVQAEDISAGPASKAGFETEGFGDPTLYWFPPDEGA